MHDIVIAGGRIADGTGAPAMSGDVAIDGDRIVQVGGFEATGVGLPTFRRSEGLNRIGDDGP